MRLKTTWLHAWACRLRIPMRGYEIVMMVLVVAKLGVTHPHEGLWVNVASAITIIAWSYASPWGVMSACTFSSLFLSVKLRIPMRGYEITSYTTIRGFYWGYASPWGVMRLLDFCCFLSLPLLRIPMRGYEHVDIITNNLLKPVTHPHEGLWVNVLSML